MKIVSDGHLIILEQVYSGVMLRTKEGNQIGICMRDDTFEINVIPKGKEDRKWFRVDMQKRTIEEMVSVITDIKDTDLSTTSKDEE